jgi:hypothetical protein
LEPVNSTPNRLPAWLFVLCALLLVWQPVSFGLVASAALDHLPIAGAPLAAMLVARVLVTAFGIAAGLALLMRRPGAVTLAKASLVVSAAMDLVVYTTPYFPNNRAPGETPIYLAVALAYYGLWLSYLFRSKSVRELDAVQRQD